MFSKTLIIPSLLISISATFVKAQVTYPVHAVSSICPEYVVGGVNFYINYRAEGGDQFTEVTNFSQNVDINQKRATFDFRVPIEPKKIVVSVGCKSNQGVGRISNELSASFCDSQKFSDSDGDGLTDHQEDTNCDGFYSPGDLSNLHNVDTDGDGVRDLAEVLEFKDPSNPGSSPRPFVYSGGVFDYDKDNSSDPVIWRPSNGTFYIKKSAGGTTSIKLGKKGDIPFTYLNNNSSSDVGVISLKGNDYIWTFNGTGLRINGVNQKAIQFGLFGDNIVLGNWESPNFTSLGVARVFNGQWTFSFLKSTGETVNKSWGIDGDVTFVGDYDFDGILDPTVYRGSTNTIFVLKSSGGSTAIYNFGLSIADFSVRGDITNDGRADMSFWEPINAKFYIMTSTNGFNDTQANLGDPNYFREVSLGQYYETVPLNFQRVKGVNYLGVVSHRTGIRTLKSPLNNQEIQIQWGLPDDSQG